MTLRIPTCVVALFALVATAQAAVVPAPIGADGCPDIRMPPVALPKSRDALARNQELVIVALGSSSTQSWMSSNPAHSYPAILQQALMRALPGAHIAVINRGIGGQDASEEVARLDNDVIAIHPALVIWQVGANGALKDVDPKFYKTLVSSGIRRLQNAGSDVVLMDNQRSPRIIAAPHHLLIDQATAEVATETGASLFSRSLLMDSWQHDGSPYERFISTDGLHQNDLGYRCIAEALAASIAAGLGPDKPGSSRG